ncbi:MAG: superkiller [Alyxoria varia]|nr:MAG: superkiller [Alyxoria varia]
MSKQYLTAHTLAAHPSDAFTLAATPSTLLSASGSSTLKIHSTNTTSSTTTTASSTNSKPDAPSADIPPLPADTTSTLFPESQTIKGAHRLGCHHLCASLDGTRAASVGFEGSVRVWDCDPNSSAEGERDGGVSLKEATPRWREADVEVLREGKAGEVWAIALSAEGRYLAGTTVDGRVSVWDLDPPGEQQNTTDTQNTTTTTTRRKEQAREDASKRNQKAKTKAPKIREYESKTGSIGLSVDISPDSLSVASAHATGSLYIYSTSTGRLAHTLPSLQAPVRSCRFSPSGTLLAAAGDSRVIGLYDVKSGEQVAILGGGGGGGGGYGGAGGSGHNSWIMCLDWSPRTGEWLASGSWDGKVKVWSVERRVCVATVDGSGGGAGGKRGGGGGVGGGGGGAGIADSNNAVGDNNQEEDDASPQPKAVWCLRWLPSGISTGIGIRKAEGFVAGNARGGLVFFREAAGG